MSVDRGFTSAFGGTFGVVIALFVIFILFPGCLMGGCVALVGTIGATSNAVDKAGQAAERREQERAAIRAEEYRREQLELQQREAEENRRIDAERERELEKLRERNHQEQLKREAEFYRESFGGVKSEADDNTADYLQDTLPKNIFGK